MAALDVSANAGPERGMSRRFAPRRLRARGNRLGQGAEQRDVLAGHLRGCSKNCNRDR